MLLWHKPPTLTTGLLLLLGQTGPARVRAKLELELNGFGNGWTDVSADLMDGETVYWGLPGNSPRDRVARTGELRFSLNNSPTNLARREGFYSPDHANCRPNFAEGIRVRYSQLVPGSTNTGILHVGTLDAIDPEPDALAGSYMVRCTSVDYMDDLARASCSGLTVLQNVTDDEIFDALIAVVPRQPEAIETSPGPDTFPVALDKVENKTRVVSVLHDVAQSSLSLIFPKGETLVYEPRNVRASKTSSVDTFTTQLVGLEASRNRANRLNRVEVTAHPRKVDGDPTTVLWQLPSPIDASNSVFIPANTSVVLWTPYTDPANPGQSIGGLDVDETPVAGTDYVFTENANGTGTVLTSNIQVTVEPFVSTAKVTYRNTGASGYLVTARVLGRGIYDYSPTLSQADDEESQINAGLNLLSFDAPYQSSIATAAEIAVYLVNLYKGAATQVNRIKFHVPAHDYALANRLLSRNISDRVSFSESLTGLSASRAYFINAVAVSADNRNNLDVEWLLAPADQTAYWLLEVVGRSELDRTTVLGFGLVLGHTDVAHGDAHSDFAHSDSAHEDVQHEDVAHGDAGHGDTAHSDTAHSDTAHSDVSHSDSHSDTSHADSHSDVAHSDVAHSDVPFVDIHDDFDDIRDSFLVHDDFSDAQPHSDSHTDVAHGDTHSDTAHADAHSDVSHGDAAHTDVSHVDTAHSDQGHVDAGHSDVSHVDTAHSDTTHGDNHSDTAHGDIN
jgi:hypothetical protein